MCFNITNQKLMLIWVGFLGLIFLEGEKSGKINVLSKKEKSAFTQNNSERGASNMFWKINWKNKIDVKIYRAHVTINFFGVSVFLLTISVNDPCFVSISVLVLELWNFSFLYITPSIFCPISGDWGKLRILNLEKMLLNAGKRQGIPLLLFLSY